MTNSRYLMQLIDTAYFAIEDAATQANIEAVKDAEAGETHELLTKCKKLIGQIPT